MSDDIVTRLREHQAGFRAVIGMNTAIAFPSLYEQAADEIERLRADRDRWHKIANRLVSGAERQIDEWRPAGKANTNDVWLSAWHEYDKAVRGE